MLKRFLAVAIFIGIASGLHLPKRSKAFPDNRIVGGVDVNIASFGWQVSIQSFSNHFCGGSILNEEWILTAAHCIEDEWNPELSVSIRVGSSKWNDGGEEYDAKQVIMHPKYNNITYDYDAGLVRIATPITLDGRRVRTATLIESGEELVANSTLAVTGWGALKEGGPASEQLQGVSVPVVDNKLCEVIYGSKGRITERMICAGYTEGGKDSCQGDSGGPIVDKHKILVGIVSWGSGCARPDKPGVYTKVAHKEIREFIHENTGI